MADLCSHLREVATERTSGVHPRAKGCQECLATGGEWEHLRLCLSCGYVGCSDESPGQHATGHFQASHHPVIKSFEPGEDWAWCFEDEVRVDSLPAFPDESPSRHYELPYL